MLTIALGILLAMAIIAVLPLVALLVLGLVGVIMNAIEWISSPTKYQ